MKYNWTKLYQHEGFEHVFIFKIHQAALIETPGEPVLDRRPYVGHP